MLVKMFIDGVTIEVEEAHVQEYKNRGWKTENEANALQNAKELAEKQQKRVFELMGMKKEEQLALIEELGGTDDGRGTAEERIKLIIELEKGL